MQAQRIIDSHIHVWSDGKEPYPWLVDPPPALHAAATTEKFVESARAAGVSGTLIVQPANHKWDHRYVTSALRSHPEFFKGMALANPALGADAAVAELARLHSEESYVGVRFNPGHFADGLDSPVGRALYAKAGELGMPVGVMAYSGLPALLPALRALLDAHPTTRLIIDHMGFFRQPASGGLLSSAAENDEGAFSSLLGLAEHPGVLVKISALFRTSAERPPHSDVQPRIAALVRAFGARRLMWGSDFPWVTIGGNTPTEAALTYAQAVAMPGSWSAAGLDQAAFDLIMGGTAAEVFGFGACASK